MKINPLTRIANGYRQMPYLGAALNVTADGAVHNGMVIIHKFKNHWRAFHALKDAGFVRTSYGWKLAR